MRYLTGCKPIDELTGGYYPRVVHLYFGETMSGKTTLGSYVPIGAIAKALGEKLKKDQKFVVVDGDGGFDYERAEQVWKGFGLDPNIVFDHVLYYQPTTFKDQHIEVTDLAQALKDERATPLFMSVDPMVAFYRGTVLRTSRRFKLVSIGEYTGRLDLQLVTMRQMAVKYNIPVVGSSWPGSGVGRALGTVSNTPVIGGRALGFMPKIMIGLSLPAGSSSSLRLMNLWKHRARPPGLFCYFKLTNKGVEAVTQKEIDAEMAKTPSRHHEEKPAKDKDEEEEDE